MGRIQRKFQFPGASLRIAAINALRSYPMLTYTRFLTGVYMDWFSPPTPLQPSFLTTHINLLLDIPSAIAIIPGSGDIPVVLTHSSTIARFLAAALELENWPEASVMVGERGSLKELVGIAQSVTGISLFRQGVIEGEREALII
jgi:hypothetical protein